MEGRDAEIAKVPGAYLRKNIDEEVVVVLKVELAELLVLTEPSLYLRYVVIEKNRKPIIYTLIYKSHCVFIVGKTLYSTANYWQS